MTKEGEIVADLINIGSTFSLGKGGRGGRKRNGEGNTSLVHSIPKFSEVVPKGDQRGKYFS